MSLNLDEAVEQATDNLEFYYMIQEGIPIPHSKYNATQEIIYKTMSRGIHHTYPATCVSVANSIRRIIL